MLAFSRLRLTGFKSFVESTDLPIEKGLTGVVGPNGCGKSNLVEALRWAMGEVSARRMRGGGMDDIIFAGSGGRARRDVAEVELFLDNPSGDDLGMFSGWSELVVSRRIAREQGTTYSVNGTEVRARDVQTLFADSATGAQSPSIVRQGRIAAMISAKPIERRRFLEEAAGISGLHARRREAEIKLRAAGNNLGRLEEVLRQIEGQRRSLSHQAREAARYRDLAGELRRAETLVLHIEWLAARAEAEAAAGALQEAEAQVATAATLADQAATAQAQAGLALPSLRAAATTAVAQLEGLEGERRALQREVQQAEANLAAGVRRSEQLKTDLERVEAQARDADEACVRAETELANVSGAAKSGEAKSGDADSGTDSGTDSGADDEATETRLAHAAEQATARAEAARQASAAAHLVVRAAEAAHAAAEARAEACGTRVAELARAEKKLGSALAEDATAEDAPNESTTEEEKQDPRVEDPKVQDPKAARAAEAQALGEAEAARARCEERRAAAETARRAHARAAAEAQALERALEAPQAEMWPPLLTEVEAEAGFEKALAAALGDDLFASLREGAPLAWRAQESTETPPPFPEGVEPLAAHVRAPQALGARLARIGVADSPERAEALQSSLRAGQRLVSRAGGLWRWDGFTARDAAQSPAVRRLRQRADLTRAREALPGLNRAAETAETALGEAEEARTAHVQAWERARAAADAAWREAEARAARAERARLATESATARTQLEQAREHATAAEVALAAPRTAHAQAERTTSEALEAHARARAEAESFAHTRRARAQRRTQLRGELAEWRARGGEANRHRESLLERVREAEAERVRLHEAPTALDARSKSLDARVAESALARTRETARLESAEARHNETGAALRRAEAVRQERREERIRLEGRLEQSRARVEAVAAQADERLALRPERLLEKSGWDRDKPLPSHSAAHKRLESLRTERERIGPVNLRAEHEIRELEEKLATMQGEREELEGGVARLREGIQTLNREGRKRLLAAFTEVNANFTHLFQRLFGGGSAQLEMVESSDPLEAGLEITASPPGKRLQSLSLLSGGEQSLTALALLFGVFQTNPAPICVLDEVDAALDDVNVHRFCDLLEELASTMETRFLVITHHRHTMARMDRLFGVTMPERGVSRLVSVDLARAETIRENA